MEKHTYVIDLMAVARYIIKAASEDEAVERAYDYFAERTPDCSVEIDDDEEPEIEI